MQNERAALPNLDGKDVQNEMIKSPLTRGKLVTSKQAQFHSH